MQKNVWYRIHLQSLAGTDGGYRMERETAEVLSEDETCVTLAVVSKTGTPLTVVKTMNRGPYYPSLKLAATAKLVSVLGALTEAEETCTVLRHEYKALLPYC